MAVAELLALKIIKIFFNTLEIGQKNKIKILVLIFHRGNEIRCFWLIRLSFAGIFSTFNRISSPRDKKKPQVSFYVSLENVIFS
jgi:hypothetical protein